MRHLEDDLQTAFFAWADHYKKLDFMHAVPNGGKRNIREAVRLKRQGTKSGVFDVYLPMPKKGHHGLYIEFKIGKNKLSANQKIFKKYVEDNGYKAVVIYNLSDAMDLVCDYADLI